MNDATMDADKRRNVLPIRVYGGPISRRASENEARTIKLEQEVVTLRKDTLDLRLRISEQYTVEEVEGIQSILIPEDERRPAEMELSGQLEFFGHLEHETESVSVAPPGQLEPETSENNSLANSTIDCAYGLHAETIDAFSGDLIYENTVSIISNSYEY